MTRDTLVLVPGIDVGTSGPKAVLLDPDGNTVDEATASYGLRSPRPGWTEQDPDDWWTATREAFDKVRAQRVLKAHDDQPVQVRSKEEPSHFVVD